MVLIFLCTQKETGGSSSKNSRMPSGRAPEKNSPANAQSQPTRPVEAHVQSSTRVEALELGDEEDVHELAAATAAIERHSGISTQTASAGREDAEAERRLTIAEAFADDDVLAEFREEKRALEEEEQPKSVDLTLPGWGDWAGVLSI